jgi:competence protein ComEC
MIRPEAWGLPAVLAGALIGIATADAGWWALAFLATAAGAALAVGLAAVRRKAGRAGFVIAIVLLVGMVSGGVRGSMAAPAGGPTGVESLPTNAPLRFTAVVADEPTPRATAHDLVLEGLVLTNGGPDAGPRPGRLLVRVPRAFAVQAGDEVALEVTLRPSDAADPEEAAYRERLRRQGIGGLGSAWELWVVGHRSNPLLEAPAILRRWLLDGLVRTVPEPEASLGAGILLGVRTGIDPTIRDAFAVAGLSHVVAISGWNVAIVVALIAAATQRLRARFGPRLPAVVAMLAVAWYVALVGASPAVVRAALMAAALLVARLGGSPAHAASALMGAVVVMVLVSPGALWDVGFQLSALATAGLIVLAAPIESRLGRWPPWIRTPVALTVAAQAATLPVLLATFEQVSLVAPLANVLVVPLIPAVMAGAAAAAMIGGLAGAIPVPLAADVGTWLAGGAAWLPLRGLIAVGTTAAALPLAAMPLAGAPWFTAAWYPGLALVVHRLNRRADDGPPGLEPMEAAAGLRHALPEVAAFAPTLAWAARPRRVAVGVVLAVVLATAMGRSDGRLHVTVLDIGQGDAILIEAPGGATALVDGGPDPDLTLRQLGQSLPFHRRRIDVVVLTHPHQDHLGGLGEVLRRYDVGLVVDGGRPVATEPHRALLAAAAREPGARIVAARAGEVIRIGEVTLEVVFPDALDVAAPLPEGDVNNGSIVLLVRYGAFEALLTGDAEAPVEALLGARGRLGAVEVLKVAHHGSDSGTTAEFLEATRPAVAVVSAGVDNSYGHPHRSTLDALTQVPGLRLFRTDLDGNVEVVTDGASYWVASGRGEVGPLPAR